MKKYIQYIIGIILVGAVSAYIAITRNNTTPVTATKSSDVTETPVTSTTVSLETTPTPTPTTLYKDGTYTGDAVDAVYGTVQVSALISAGKIKAVKILQKPDSQGETTLISNRVMPLLTQEAITKQTAHVNIISGATQTSEGFQASLTSALALAKN